MPRLLGAVRARSDARLRADGGRRWAAEAAGTALLVLAIVLAAALTLGAGSPVRDALPGRGARFAVLGALVAPCVALIALSPFGRLSGAHLNPAVTLAFWVLGRISSRDAGGYIAAQVVGAVAGACTARLLLPAPVAASIGGGVTHPAVGATRALAVEAGMTAALLVLVIGFASRGRLARWTPLAIVPLLTVVIWLGSPATGASINPARSAGPALAFGDLADLWIYVVAPAAAAVAVALLWRSLPAASTARMHGMMPRPAAGGA